MNGLKATGQARVGVAFLLAGIGGMPAVSAQENAAAQTVSPAAAQRATGTASLPGLGASRDPSPPGKDYALPALEIIGFDTILNRVNHRFIKDTRDYDVSLSSMRRNLHSSWVIDGDPFKTNQFLHPYQGAIYHGFARSAGMDYWQSLGYTFAGSAFWEIFGETTLPSRNDQIASGIAGSFLGESLFRLSNLVLDNTNQLSPTMRQVAAAAVAPSAAFNRLAFGKRFDVAFDSHEPAYYGRLQLGVNSSSRNDAADPAGLQRTDALANFAIDYGLPGKNGYHYTRPFDYFNLEATASSANGVESISNRGMLIGREYEMGANYRGIYGLYGSYDYIAPQLFRVSSTALSLGSTAQWWLSRSIALQGTATTGFGYAAAGSVRPVGERDYNYGIAPQALLALRLTFDDTAALDFNAREFFVSSVAASSRGGHENILRADATATFRIKGQHAIAVKYLWSHRDAYFPRAGDQTQTRGTIGVYYTLLGRDGFGSVDWR